MNEEKPSSEFAKLTRKRPSPEYVKFLKFLCRDVEIGLGLRKRKFLWLPKRISNGRWAWLRTVYECYDLNKPYEGEGALSWAEKIYEEI